MTEPERKGCADTSSRSCDVKAFLEEGTRRYKSQDLRKALSAYASAAGLLLSPETGSAAFTAQEAELLVRALSNCATCRYELGEYDGALQNVLHAETVAGSIVKNIELNEEQKESIAATQKLLIKCKRRKILCMYAKEPDNQRYQEAASLLDEMGSEAIDPTLSRVKKDINAFLNRNIASDSKIESVFDAYCLFRSSTEAGEHFQVGHDDPVGPLLGYDEENAIRIESNGLKCNILIGGMGDGRHVLFAILDFLDQLVNHNLSSDQQSKAKFFLVGNDIKEESLCKVLATLDMAITLSKALGQDLLNIKDCKPGSRVCDLSLMLSGLYCDHLVPVSVEKLLRAQFKKWSEASVFPFEWAQLSGSKKQQQESWKKLALIFKQWSNLSDEIEAPFLEQLRLSAWKSVSRSNVWEMGGSGNQRGSTIKYPKEDGELGILLPPKPYHKHYGINAKKISKLARLDKDYVTIEDVSSAGLVMNPAHISVSFIHSQIRMVGKENILYRGAKINNFVGCDMPGFISNVYASPLLGKGRRSDSKTNLCWHFATFIAHVGRAVTTIKDKASELTMEFSLGDVYELAKVYNPSGGIVTKTFDRIFLSNIPDYTGLLSTFVSFAPLLNPQNPKATIKNSCLRWSYYGKGKGDISHLNMSDFSDWSNYASMMGGFEEKQGALESYLYSSSRVPDLDCLKSYLGIEHANGQLSDEMYWVLVADDTTSIQLPKKAIVTQWLYDLIPVLAYPPERQINMPNNHRPGPHLLLWFRLCEFLVYFRKVPPHWITNVIEMVLHETKPILSGRNSAVMSELATFPEKVKRTKQLYRDIKMEMSMLASISLQTRMPITWFSGLVPLPNLVKHSLKFEYRTGMLENVLFKSNRSVLSVVIVDRMVLKKSLKGHQLKKKIETTWMSLELQSSGEDFMSWMSFASSDEEYISYNEIKHIEGFHLFSTVDFIGKRPIVQLQVKIPLSKDIVNTFQKHDAIAFVIRTDKWVPISKGVTI